MKKISMTMALLIAGFYLQAQQVRFGVKAGANLSSLTEYDYLLTGYEDASLDYKVGFNAGVFSQIFINKNWGLETGLYFTQLGGQDRERDLNEDYRLRANASYLQLPVSVFREIRLPGKVRLYPALGAYAGYGIAGKIKSSGHINNIDISQEQDYFKDFARRFDVGATAGIQVGLDNFLFGAAYDQGVVRVNSQKVNWEENGYNSNFKLTVGYLF
ncbi:porin family protein [Sphingobacterium oryzagri]|uniref:Porin family protein n=1 Tax=Sphingobacterium oryzagri TaxID=3025669 RepID=A0ABY7WKT4_9SPHI|nr:porin family protein [Sphingobacterium sp. KACC 22765]WDF70207.1 porin family protein [Sphingobacterium sp. KACC 22765]